MSPRMTPQTWVVMQEFFAKPTGRYGLELAHKTGLATGTVYPILDRLVEARLLDVEQETVNAVNERRPPRRLFTINKNGREWVAAEAERMQKQRRWLPGLAIPRTPRWRFGAVR